MYTLYLFKLSCTNTVISSCLYLCCTYTVLTPNGRFKTNTRLCLSMSDFHPETWNPLWNVGTILTGVLSFMLENTATYGSIDSTDSEKRKYAAESLAYNIKNDKFCELFPHYKVQHFNNVKQQKQNNNITTDTNTVQHNNVNINNNNTDNNVTERLLNNNNNGTNTQHTLPINNNHNNIQQHNNIDMQPHAHDQNRLYVKLIAISIVSTIILSLWYFLT